MRSIEGLMLLLSLVAGGVACLMGVISGDIALLILLCAVIALLALLASALISNRWMPDTHRPSQGWTAWRLFALGSRVNIGSSIRFLAIGAGLLQCLSMLMFGFWAGFVLIYSFGR